MALIEKWTKIDRNNQRNVLAAEVSCQKKMCRSEIKIRVEILRLIYMSSTHWVYTNCIIQCILYSVDYTHILLTSSDLLNPLTSDSVVLKSLLGERESSSQRQTASSKEHLPFSLYMQMASIWIELPFRVQNLEPKIWALSLELIMYKQRFEFLGLRDFIMKSNN